MTLKTPKVISEPLRGIWAGRNSIKSVLLKRHTLPENFTTVQRETENVQANLNPYDWLFLIEGSNKRHRIPFSPFENQSLQIFTDENGIKTEDPIVNPFTPSISDKTSIDREIAATSVLVLDYLVPFLEDAERLPNGKELDELIRQCTESVAEQFDMRVNNVRREFSRLSWHNGFVLSREINLLAKVRQTLINESNIQSRKRLTGILDKNQQPNVFIMSGGAHEPVFEPFFAVPREIHFELARFSGVAGTNQNPSSIEKMLSLKEVTNGIGFQANAASSEIAGYMNVKGYLNDRAKKLNEGRADFNDIVFILNLDDYYALRDYKTEIICGIVQKITPGKLSKPYSQSKLMEWSTCDPVKEISIWFDWFGTNRAICRNAAVNSAIALRIIVEKIGNSLPDEAEIIRKLLTAPLDEVRNEGVKAVYSARKHKWRNDSDAVWGIVRTLGIQTVPERKRKVTLSIISADPRFLFAKDKDESFITYKGKDVEIEKILVECSQEHDPQIRTRAFSTIGKYLLQHQIDDPSLDDILVKGLENKDQGGIYAVYHRLKRGLIRNPRLLSLLKEVAHDSVWQNRSNALGSLSFCLEREKINDPELKQIARNNLHDENEHIRAGASKIFGLVISLEPVLEVQGSDVQSLLHIASNDLNKLARNNATYGLAVITNRNFDLIPKEKSDQIEHLCAVNRDPEVASTNELQTINESLNRLVTVSGLEDAKLLLELEEHPSRAKVEQLIRKKDKYRDAIGPLLDRIGALYQANIKLGASLEALTVENLALKEEEVILRQKIRELAQELSRINASIRSNRVNKLLLSIGGTAFRNIVKNRGVAHTEFVKSIFIDAGWDQIVGLIT